MTDNLYSTAEKVLAGLKEEDDYTWEDDAIEVAAIRKDYIDEDSGPFEVWINSDLEVIKYIGRDIKDGLVVLRSLDEIFIHIPVPFVKGDLLEYDGNPCVLLNLPHWSHSYEKKVEGKISDYSDMWAHVCLVDEELYPHQGLLTFNDGPPPFVYQLKYHAGKLKGNDRFLGFLSDFMKKGDTAVHHLLYAFEKIKAQTAAADSNTLFDGTFQYWAKELEGDK